MTKKAHLLLFAIVLLALTHSYAQAQNMMLTWIGNAGSGYFGDNGPAYQAQIGKPADVCFDANHNFYFVDRLHSVVRKVSGGIITTVAGKGSTGYSGDGSLAINAELAGPNYLCVDRSGNILVSDTWNNVIRKINKVTGIITTIAGNRSIGLSGDGGPATAATLYEPYGICTDTFNNIYFADYSNHAIRRIDAVTGIITTLAGNGTIGFSGDGGPATAALLYTPTAIRLDASGNIFFSDEQNNRIRKINAVTGIITTVAGNGTNIFSGDGGPALNAGIGYVEGICFDKNGDMIINDRSCSCRRIDMATGIINVIAGDGVLEGYNGDGLATAHLLYTPLGLCIDPANGNIIIADSDNNRIRKVGPKGNRVNVADLPGSYQPRIFPNPTTGLFNIEGAKELANAQADVINAAGERVYTTSLAGSQTSVDISSQPPGIYFLNITSVEGVYSQKITISR